MQPFAAVLICWAAFVVYWLYAARHVKRPRVRQPILQRVLLYAAMIVTFLLLIRRPVPPWPFIDLRIWPAGPVAGWLGAALGAAGTCFAFWARHTLADNWSAEVQIKENHALVTAGPYAIVRHPIYAGLVASLIGTWMTVGSLGSLVGILLGFVGLWRKMLMEERLMRQQFPAEYPEYEARVKRLVPGVL